MQIENKDLSSGNEFHMRNLKLLSEINKEQQLLNDQLNLFNRLAIERRNQNKTESERSVEITHNKMIFDVLNANQSKNSTTNMLDPSNLKTPQLNEILSSGTVKV